MRPGAVPARAASALLRRPMRDLRVSDLPAVLFAAAQQSLIDDVPSLAAGVAFRIFLSVFPALIAATAIVSLVVNFGEFAGLIDTLQYFAPADTHALIQRELGRLVFGDHGRAGSIAAVAVVVGLYTATTAAVTVIRALNRINGITARRPFWRLRLVALLLTLALLGALLALMLLLVLGTRIQARILFALNLSGTGFEALLRIGRVLCAVVVLILLFAFVYWRAPYRVRPRWQWFSPGALVGVAGWLGLSGLFNLYVERANTFGATYGTLSSVVVLLIWLHLTMLLLLYGAEVDAELARVRARRRAGTHRLRRAKR